MSCRGSQVRALAEELSKEQILERRLMKMEFTDPAHENLEQELHNMQLQNVLAMQKCGLS